MMVEVFKYTERVVNMVRPRKLLFMAIGELPIPLHIHQTQTIPQDGVAPRAKMNQQRSRRFRSAQEAREKYEARLEAEAEWKGVLYSLIKRKGMLTVLFQQWARRLPRKLKRLGTPMPSLLARLSCTSLLIHCDTG